MLKLLWVRVRTERDRERKPSSRKIEGVCAREETEKGREKEIE